MKRPLFIGLLALLVLACAACGGGARHSAAARSGLPAPLVQQIKAEIQKASVIGGAAAAKSADVYGPASYAVIDRAWKGGSGAMAQVSGRWYLIVLHGNFHWNGPVPPGAKLPAMHRNLALVAWSPNAHGLASGGTGYTAVERVPRTISRLGVPAAISLS